MDISIKFINICKHKGTGLATINTVLAISISAIVLGPIKKISKARESLLSPGGDICANSEEKVRDEPFH